MPIGDETRRPSQFPMATASIIALNVVVFMLPRDKIRTVFFFGWLYQVTFIPAALLSAFGF
jgi:hypothetical protein